MLRDRIKTATPAAHAIRIERRCFRCHPDDHQFRLRVDVNELAVDAERDQHAAIAVDAVPLVAIAAFRKYLSHFRTRPCLGIAALVDIVDPRAWYHLPAIRESPPAHHLAEACEVTRRDADAAGGAHRVVSVDGDIAGALRAQRHPQMFAEDLAGALIDPAEHIGIGRDIMKQSAVWLSVRL